MATQTALLSEERSPRVCCWYPQLHLHGWLSWSLFPLLFFLSQTGFHYVAQASQEFTVYIRKITRGRCSKRSVERPLTQPCISNFWETDVWRCGLWCGLLWLMPWLLSDTLCTIGDHSAGWCSLLARLIFSALSTGDCLPAEVSLPLPPKCLD